ncbi:ADP-ribosylglycohydrolase family protein [Pyxidicoccus fallax]|uniref:Crystallin J1 n=1 Tax=Pyxidicoccus fallax TaxID=394095 RepID=A0A848LJV0_9BACT|nr:ADP-ribosylglycohydrolase family protein [Pyxidicoccus fallax]NMO17966.1 crystallin J1 [Pyxidicoccus fallax]NPC78997.1 ADP-ribosylglycohydrolase family protein [Pyxidicoccus fallax]
MDLAPPTPRERAALSLLGLSVGDAFGEQFFRPPDEEERLLALRTPPPAPWPYTDDTEMALSVVAELWRYGAIDRDRLALGFARHYDGSRGYGPAMHRVLRAVREGEPWADVTRREFSAQGSWGNGAAMRAGPLGAFFAGDMDAVVEQAHRSAEVTHAHPEAIAGAIAVAVAAAMAWGERAEPSRLGRPEFLEQLLPFIPESDVRSRIRKARALPATASVPFAVSVLGNGTALSAQDTVPFALWCAGAHLDDFEQALWLAVSGGGDRDTLCAMVGSIVVLAAGKERVPSAWLAAREPLPDWPFESP